MMVHLLFCTVMKTAWTRCSAVCSLLFKRTDIDAVNSEADGGSCLPAREEMLCRPGGVSLPPCYIALQPKLLHLDFRPDAHIGDTAIPQYSYKPSESHRDLLKLCKEPQSCQTLASPNTSWALQNCGRPVCADINALVWVFFVAFVSVSLFELSVSIL